MLFGCYAQEPEHGPGSLCSCIMQRAIARPPWRCHIRYAPQEDAHLLDVVTDGPLAVELGVDIPQTAQHLLSCIAVRGAFEDEVGFIFDLMAALSLGKTMGACALV